MPFALSCLPHWESFIVKGDRMGFNHPVPGIGLFQRVSRFRPWRLAAGVPEGRVWEALATSCHWHYWQPFFQFSGTTPLDRETGPVPDRGADFGERKADLLFGAALFREPGIDPDGVLAGQIVAVGEDFQMLHLRDIYGK